MIVVIIVVGVGCNRVGGSDSSDGGGVSGSNSGGNGMVLVGILEGDGGGGDRSGGGGGDRSGDGGNGSSGSSGCVMRVVKVQMALMMGRGWYDGSHGK